MYFDNDKTAPNSETHMPNSNDVTTTPTNPPTNHASNSTTTATTDIIKSMLNVLMTHSNDTVDSGLFSARCSSSGDEEPRISPMPNYFDMNNNNNNPHFGNIIVNQLYHPNQQQQQQPVPMDLKLQEQLMEQAQHADYLNIIRNRFNSCSSIEPFGSSPSNWNQMDNNNNNSAQLYNPSRRHNSFSIPQTSAFGMEQMIIMPSRSFHDASLLAVQPTEHINQLSSNQMSQSLGSSLMSNLQTTSLEKHLCLDPNCSIQPRKGYK